MDKQKDNLPHEQTEQAIEQPVSLSPESEIERSLTKAERDKIDSEDFADPDNKAYPCDTQAHVTAACTLLGHAPESKQAAIKKRIIAIAKRKGFSLPDSWQEEENSASERSASPDEDTSGSVEEHMDKKEERATDATLPQVAHLFAPITRVDTDKWEVEGVATSETIDSYNTIFSYPASKKAFQKWIERTANVREMHDRKAVAKGVGVFFDDENKQIIVRSRVSKGAKDTWAKVEEGILCGYSVGASNPVWGKVERNGKTYPYLESYDLTELSLVDNASNPDAHGLMIARADGLNTEVVSIVDEEPKAAQQHQQPEVARVGAKMSKETMANMHSMRDTAMKTCGCDECQAMMSATERVADAKSAEALLEERITHALSGVTLRLNAIASEMARSQRTDATSAIVERLEDKVAQVEQRVRDTSALDAMKETLATIQAEVKRIADQPTSGGPALRLADSATEKRVATDPESTKEDMSKEEVIRRASEMGLIDPRRMTPQQQVNAAFAAIKPF